MAKVNQIVSRTVMRWRQDLIELTSGLTTDPLAKGRGRRWERDFPGEIGPSDVHYAIFLAILSLIPAAVVAYTATGPQWLVMAHFFRAPLQVAVSGFLSSVLIFAGTHFNRDPRPFSVAFKLTLRLLAIHPILSFLLLFRAGEPLSLLIYGFFVIRGVRKTYNIPAQNVVVFFGAIYVMFALLQAGQSFGPATPPPQPALDSFLPPSR